jgi:hypothetical protein
MRIPEQVEANLRTAASAELRARARVRKGRFVGKGFKPKRHSKEPRERINCPRRVLEETEVKKSQSGRVERGSSTEDGV